MNQSIPRSEFAWEFEQVRGTPRTFQLNNSQPCTWADQNKNMASTIIWLPPISSLLSLFQLIDSPGWHRFSNNNQPVVPHKKTQLSGWAKCAQFCLGGDIECTLLYFTVISTISMNRAAAMVYGTGRHWPVSTTTGAYFVKACFTYTAPSSLKKKC